MTQMYVSPDGNYGEASGLIVVEVPEDLDLSQLTDTDRYAMATTLLDIQEA